MKTPVHFLLLFPLAVTSLACPTRPSTGSMGSGGTSSGGVGSTGGVGGGAVCSDTDSDKLNCGSCGHSCLGGDCSGGICKPLLLGTVTNISDFARQTVVTEGKVYIFTQVGQGAATNAWQFDADLPSTPTEVMTNGTVSCVMGGQLFWATNGSPNTIYSCSFANCAATTTPAVTLANTDRVTIFPACDSANNEIVWGTMLEDGSSSIVTIHRASSTGTNARVVTSFVYPTNGGFADSGVVPGQANRFFYTNGDGSGNDTLYYVSTDTLNAQSVSVATVSGAIDTSDAQSLLANDTIVLISGSFIQEASTVDQVFSAPLPNGVLSGAPPVFMPGDIFGGVIDQTNFYGSVSESTVPTDAVIKCPLSDCSSPAIMARGQASANYFADDATAIYWTTSGQMTALWKLAK